jgi:hypothetical protein
MWLALCTICPTPDGTKKQTMLVYYRFHVTIATGQFSNPAVPAFVPFPSLSLILLHLRANRPDAARPSTGLPHI